MRLRFAFLGLAVSVGLAGLVPVPPAEAGTASQEKRGIAAAMYLKTAPHKLTNAGATWSYNWTYRVPPSTSSLETVPMIRSAASISETAIMTLTEGRKSGHYKHLLGFNEPDSVNQANMTPAQAARLWPQLERTGLILGSPVPAVPNNGWLREFMRIAKQRNLRVDFIALHYYVDINDPRAVDRIRTLTQLIRRNYRKPIWITEIGIIDRRSNPGSASVNWAKARAFMTTVTTMLDSMPYVHRYAWMADNVTKRKHLKWSTLHAQDGSLTPLGRTYQRLP
jgi:hypothetical protein